MSARRRAVVVGASVAGLLAARVLSETFDSVLVVDRDDLPDEAVPRTGVPQGRHLHGLLAKGREILEQLFPGLGTELLDAGATSADLQGDIHWTIDGHPMLRTPCGLAGLSMSRSLLEHRIRGRVAHRANVTFRPRTQVTGLLAVPGRVTGVRVLRPGEDPGEDELAADLVIDASGRGSRTPVWLRELGYPAPEEESVEIGVTYATRRFRRTRDQLPGAKGAVVTMCPDNPRAGALACEEDDRWIVTLAGMRGDDPPLTPGSFAAFAESLADKRIAAVIRQAEPLGEALRARFPASVRHRYDRLDRFPDGFLVFGDAVCSFNPIYSQGMTVAAAEALVLRECLRAGEAGLSRRFFRRTARVLAVPWSMATSGDLRFDTAAGPRPPAQRIVNRYLGPLGAAIEHDPAVGRALLRVANLLDRPERLFAPDMVFRVLRAGLRGTSHRPAPSRIPARTDRAVEERP